MAIYSAESLVVVLTLFVMFKSRGWDAFLETKIFFALIVSIGIICVKWLVTSRGEISLFLLLFIGGSMIAWTRFVATVKRKSRPLIPADPAAVILSFAIGLVSIVVVSGTTTSPTVALGTFVVAFFITNQCSLVDLVETLYWPKKMTPREMVDATLQGYKKHEIEFGARIVRFFLVGMAPIYLFVLIEFIPSAVVLFLLAASSILISKRIGQTHFHIYAVNGMIQLLVVALCTFATVWDRTQTRQKHIVDEVAITRTMGEIVIESMPFLHQLTTTLAITTIAQVLGTVSIKRIKQELKARLV
jgi:hypothetical protein